MSSIRAARLDAFATVLKDPTLRRMSVSFASYSITEYSTWIAMLVYAFERGGVSEVGIVSFALLVISTVSAPLLARAISTVRPDRALAAGYALQTVTMFATAVALNQHATSLIPYVLAAACAGAHTATRPTMGPLLALVVETPTELGAANVTMTLFENAGRFVGPFLAAGVMAISSPESVFWISGAMGLLGTTLSLVPGGPERLRTAGRLPASSHVLEHARTQRSWKGFGPVLSIFALTGLLVGAGDILFVTVASHTGSEGQGAGLLNGSFGAGGVAGAAASAFLVGRSRLSPFLALGIGVLAIPVVAMSWNLTQTSAFLLFGISGIGLSLVRVAGVSLIQRLARTDAATGLFSLVESLQMAAMAVGALLGSAIIVRWGLPTTLVLFGVGIALCCALLSPALFRMDRNARAADPEMLRLFRASPIFRLLPAPALERLALDSTTTDVLAGVVITQQGEPGNEYFLILDGQVTISVDDQSVRTVSAGHGFGEVALLRDGLRTATATSVSDSRILVVTRQAFLGGLGEHRGSFEAAEAIAQGFLAPANSSGVTASHSER